MHLFVTGLDHHSSPVEVRERFAFRPSQMEAAFHALRDEVGLREAAILSTCNRVEVYGIAADAAAPDRVIAFLHRFHGLAERLATVFYTHLDAAAVEHLFGTVSGINSLVVGESQIQRQVREAAELARRHQALGATLNGLFQHALAVGKRARTETAIGRHAASVSQAGVELARSLLGDLAAAHVLLVGSGKVSELAAKNLLDNGARTITLVNRTVERAQALARQWGGRALPFDRLQEALDAADVVISSTAAPHTVIHPEQVRHALAARDGRPLILIDLAVPRDVDEAVAALPGAHVYNVDDLERVVARNLERRRAEIDAVRTIVRDETAAFLRWWSARAVVPTLTDLRAHAERIRRDEVAKALRRIGPLGEREQQIIEAMTQSIVNKLLHQPTVRLKQRSAEGDALHYAAVLQELFGLEQSHA